MASYQVRIAKHATLTGTTIDVLEFDSGFDAPIEILNTSGTAPLWVTYGISPDDPTAYGDDVLIVPAGTGRVNVVDKWDLSVEVESNASTLTRHLA